jgi:hypothetical protein
MTQLQLFSIDKTPRSLPVWELIVEDLGNPPAERIARALGVGKSTVYRWHKAGSGPRIACLALFWLTRWGHSQVHTNATNDAMVAAGLARSLQQEREQLLSQVARLEHDSRELALELAYARREYTHGQLLIEPLDWPQLPAAGAR